jgi:membrane-bound lytic murein transglycosylase D
LKKKKLKLLLVGFILLFSGFIFYKNITYGISFSSESERTHQRFIKKLPKDLHFAGEEVHFKTRTAYKNYYRELVSRTSNGAYTRISLRNAGIWFPVIEKILKEYKIPDDLKYLALAESNLTNVYSPMGATGFWQFTRVAGREMGLTINDEVDERLDPIRSTHAACRLLKRSHNYFGSWSSAVAAYNLGGTALYFAFRNQRVNSYYDLKLNMETASYLYKIIAVKDLVENTRKYGMKYQRYGVAPSKVIIVKESIKNLKEFAAKKGVSYEVLKELNPWILGNRLTLRNPDDVFYIRLPR